MKFALSNAYLAALALLPPIAGLSGAMLGTKFTGETGRAPWLADLTLDARGFGAIVDLSVAMSNDVDFGTLVKTQSAARNHLPTHRWESHAHAA